jgi:hypothetical protein
MLQLPTLMLLAKQILVITIKEIETFKDNVMGSGNVVGATDQAMKENGKKV